MSSPIAISLLRHRRARAVPAHSFAAVASATTPRPRPLAGANSNGGHSAVSAAHRIEEPTPRAEAPAGIGNRDHLS